MAYLTKFGINNFRVFKDMTDFEFAPITILTGTNSSGKSSLIKALLLLKDNANNLWNENKIYMIKKVKSSQEDIPVFDTLSFNSAIHKLASLESCINRKSEKKEIEFKFFIDLGIGEQTFLVLSYVKASNKGRTNGELNRLRVFTDKDNIKLFDFSNNKNNYWSYKINFTYLRNRIDKIANKKNGVSANNSLKGIFKGNLLPNTSLSLDSNMELDRSKYYSELPLNFYPFPVFNQYLDVSDIKDERQCILNFKVFSVFYNISHHEDLTISYIKEYVNTHYDNFLNDFNDALEQYGFNAESENGLLGLLIEAELRLLGSLRSKDIIDKRENEDTISSIIDNPKYLKSQLSDYAISYPIDLTDEKFLKNIDSLKNISQQAYLIFKTLKVLFNNHPAYKLAHKMMSLQYMQNAHYFFSELIFKRLSFAVKSISQPLNSIHFTEAVRANAQRAYSFQSQGTSFNELLKRFEELDFEDESEEILFINKWIQSYGLGQKLRLIQNRDGLGMQVYIDNDLLADSGYGITQFLPILLKIAIVAKENWSFAYLLSDIIKEDTGNKY